MDIQEKAIRELPAGWADFVAELTELSRKHDFWIPGVDYSWSGTNGDCPAFTYDHEHRAYGLNGFYVWFEGDGQIDFFS